MLCLFVEIRTNYKSHYYNVIFLTLNSVSIHNKYLTVFDTPDLFLFFLEFTRLPLLFEQSKNLKHCRSIESTIIHQLHGLSKTLSFFGCSNETNENDSLLGVLYQMIVCLWFIWNIGAKEKSHFPFSNTRINQNSFAQIFVVHIWPLMIQIMLKRPRKDFLLATLLILCHYGTTLPVLRMLEVVAKLSLH